MSSEKIDKIQSLAKDEDISSIEEISGNIKNEGVIVKSNCKMCNSRNRLEAEELYEKYGYGGIQKACDLLNKTYNEDISYIAIARHLRNHYERQKTQVFIKEYAENFKIYKSIYTDKKRSLEDTRVMLQKSFVEQMSIADSLSDSVEKRKSIELATKIATTLSSITAQINEIDKASQPYVIMLENLKHIIVDKIKESKNDDIKNALINVLDEWEKSLK